MTDEDLQPPAAPDLPRRLRLYTSQWIGMPLLLLIPVLALFGVFGESRHVVTARTGELAVEAEYPARNRYGMLADLRLAVTNTTAAALDTVTVVLDSAYATRFSSLTAIPDFERAYVIELTDLQPAETRRVRIELEGNEYGLHRGELRVGVRGAGTARLGLDTFIFP